MTKEEPKKKLPKITFKKIKKSEEQIQQQDANTYYVKSQTDQDREPYFVYKSINIGWTCDCMWYTMNMRDDGKNPWCKHIKMIIKKYNIV